MKNCRNIEADLSALIDGELPAERQAEVIEHVDNCPACARRVAELQRLAAGIGALPQQEPPLQFLAGVRRKLQPAHRWEAALFRPVWLKVPLEALAVFVIIFWLTRTHQAEPVLAMQTGPARSREVRARILSEEKLSETSVASAKVEVGEVASKPFAGAPDGGGVGGNLVDALRAEPPVSVIVRGESLVAVRLRVTELAQTLNGQVETTAPSNTFVVHLPVGKVSEFRSRLKQKTEMIYAAGAAPAVEVKVIVEPAGK